LKDAFGCDGQVFGEELFKKVDFGAFLRGVLRG
jgi:hypothetical protein